MKSSLLHQQPPKPQPLSNFNESVDVDEESTPKSGITRSTYLYAACAAVNSCNLGYDIGVSTDAGRLVQETFDLSVVERELFVASINFWAIFGALAAQYVSDTYGRRWTFLVSAAGFILGRTVMACSQSYATLMMGRTLVGLGVGVGLAIDPLYIAEVTPASHRGELVTWSEIALNIGIVFGFSTGLFFSHLDTDTEWRIMFALGDLLPIVMTFLVSTGIMPESPRWLVSKNRHDEAAKVLETILYNPLLCTDAGCIKDDEQHHQQVQLEVAEIQASLELEAVTHSRTNWNSIFRPTPAVRRMLLVGVGTAVAQQLVGIDAIQYYLLDVLAELGIGEEASGNGDDGNDNSSDTNIQQYRVLLFLGLLKLAFIVVGGKLFDKTGRRPLLFTSLLGMAAALSIVGIVFSNSSNSNSLSTSSAVTVTVGLALYLSFFSIGMGPGAWLVPAEIFGNHIRAKAMSVATTANRIASTFMSATFLSIAAAVGWATFFYLLGFTCLVVAAFLYVYLPETKGKSLEDMSFYFARLTGDTSILTEDNIQKAKATVSGSHSNSYQLGKCPPTSPATTMRTSEIL